MIWLLSRLWSTGIIDRVVYSYGTITVYTGGVEIKGVRNKRLISLLSSIMQKCDEAGIKELVAEVDKTPQT